MSTIAEFKMTGMGGNFRSVWHRENMHADGNIPGYIRVSEWIEVAFPPRLESTTLEEVAALDEKLEELKAEFARKVNAIETAKANLLALSDQRETS